MTNQEVGRALKEMALYLEMFDVPFKPQAYERAAAAVAAFDRPLLAVYEEGGLKALQQIPGVGKGIAERMHELLETGRIAELETLRESVPADVVSLTAVDGIGAKTVRTLYERLRVCTLSDLAEAATAGKLRELPRFGQKSEARIQRSLENLEHALGRLPIGQVLALAREIEARLGALDGVRAAAVAGSVRRGRETIKDLDFLVAAEKPGRLPDFFAAMPEVAQVYAKGDTKTLVRFANGLDADLRVVPPKSFGAALQYFTGSKDHNVALRRIAQGLGLKLSEYGLFRGRKSVAGATEEEVYEALGLPFIPPELRENRGEIEAAREGRLPKLLEPGRLKGDLQVHTAWSDGTGSIEDVVEAARHLGLRYLAVTDHTVDLGVAGGMDEARLREQAREVRRIDRRLRGFRLLAGAEVNIRRDGSLDVSDSVLKELDVVGAGVHAYFDLPREEQTRRLVRAMENPHVDILFHPTGRVLGRRAPIDVDVDTVVAAAVRTGTVLELDASPGRLDLRDEYVRKAVEAGAKLVIDSDAHGFPELTHPETYGVMVARRGWARRSDVLNTLAVDRLLSHLKDRAHRRGEARA